MPSVYKIVKTEKEVNKLIKYCKQTGYCTFDFETTGLEFYMEDKYPTVLGVSFQIGSAWVIPLGHFESPFKHNWRKILRRFGKAVLEDPAITKISQNSKFEIKWLMRYKIKVIGRHFDSMLAKYILDENTRHSLNYMVGRFLPEFDGYWEECDILVKKYGWAGVPLEPLAKYNGLDCDCTFRLMIYFEQRLIDVGLYSLFRNMAMMQTRVLAESEFQGFSVDEEYLEALVNKYKILLEEKLEAIYSMRIIKRYDKKRMQQTKDEMIVEVNEELDELEADNKDGKNDRLIANREEKVSRYVAGEFTSKKEQKRREPLNMQSPKQLIDLFFTSEHGFGFEIIKYTKDKKTKQKTATPSTDEEVLKELEPEDGSGFITALLEYRGLAKLNSTYVVGVYEKVYKGKIYTNFKIHGTVTGRLSSVNPNLQNIPRDTTAEDIKKMFVPPEGFNLMFELDYSQAELRIIAELANDKNMLAIFERDENVHMATGMEMEFKEYTKEEYNFYNKTRKDSHHPDYVKCKKVHKKGKVMNFSVVYQQGDKKTAEDLKVSMAEALEFKKAWFDQFSAIQAYVDKQHKFVKRHGYVKNIFGRKRRLPDVYSSQKWIRAEALRQAINAPIQGGSSDYTQFASILLRNMRLRGELPDYFIQHYTVHDSLGYPIKSEDVHWIVEKVYPVCVDPETKEWFNFKLNRVKMKTSFEVGNNWGGMESYKRDVDYKLWDDIYYYYHAESDALWSSHKDFEEEGNPDGCTEPIDRERYINLYMEIQ